MFLILMYSSLPSIYILHFLCHIRVTICDDDLDIKDDAFEKSFFFGRVGDLNCSLYQIHTKMKKGKTEEGFQLFKR